MASVDIKCPGGELVHGVLSLNDADVQCRIQGGLQPAKGSPCCGEYTKCRIWLIQQEIDRGPSTKKQRDAALATPHQHG